MPVEVNVRICSVVRRIVNDTIEFGACDSAHGHRSMDDCTGCRDPVVPVLPYPDTKPFPPRRHCRCRLPPRSTRSPSPFSSKSIHLCRRGSCILPSPTPRPLGQSQNSCVYMNDWVIVMVRGSSAVSVAPLDTPAMHARLEGQHMHRIPNIADPPPKIHAPDGLDDGPQEQGDGAGGRVDVRGVGASGRRDECFWCWCVLD